MISSWNFVQRAADKMSDLDDFEDLLENFIGSSPARNTPTEPKNEPVKLEQKMELELQKAPSPNETSTGKKSVQNRKGH